MTKDIVLFKNGELELEETVSENREDVWLSQDQMATLFDVDRSRITRHIRNIYNDKELDETSTCAENAQVQFEGKLKGILEAIYQNVFGQELIQAWKKKRLTFSIF